MYTADNFKKADDETFILKISPDRDFRILQLTDLHLGFGLFSGYSKLLRGWFREGTT